MSEPIASPLALTAIAARRSAFTPMSARRSASVEPVEAPDEYARGLNDGQLLAAAAFDMEKQALLALLANAETLQSNVGPELAVLLRESVVRLARQIVANIEIDAEYLDSRIAEAVAIITEADDARRICLNPDDAALVGDRINDLGVHSDPDLPRGAVRIDCSKGWIEHDVALGLDRLRTLLGEPA